MSDLRPNSEIADGIHWIKSGFANNYIIVENDELTLIDTSFNKKAKGIIDYIRTELSDMIPAKIYLTHHHLDHMGGVRKLEDEFNPRIFAHEHDADVIRGQRIGLPSNPIVKPIMWIMLKLMRPKPVQQSIELVEDGMSVNGIKIYHLPGHTMGSIGFLRSSTMFSGDAAITGDDGETVKLGSRYSAEDWDKAHHSLKKLANINEQFEQILPGHGMPILEDAYHRVQVATEKL